MYRKLLLLLVVSGAFLGLVSGPAHATPTITASTAPTSIVCPALVSTLKFNPCASIDKTQTVFVKNGVKYTYCWTRKVRRLCVWGNRFVNVPIWKSYRVGPKGKPYKYLPAGCHAHL
jgi:hypothetical protein